MALKLTEAARNGILDSGLDSEINSKILEIRSGSRPANAATAPTGTVLASITLPADALAAASAGTKAKSGTWSDTSADATGTATWFRIRASGDSGTTSEAQWRIDGDVGTSGADLNLDNTSIAAAQSVTINTFTFTLPAG